MSTKLKLSELGEEELLEKLKTQLVATVGTYGSRTGCPISIAFKDFAKDWKEDLNEYVRLLKYSDLATLLRTMPESFKVETDAEGFRISVISSSGNKHCLDLIDKTKASLLIKGNRQTKYNNKNKFNNFSKSIHNGFTNQRNFSNSTYNNYSSQTVFFNQSFSNGKNFKNNRGSYGSAFKPTNYETNANGFKREPLPSTSEDNPFKQSVKRHILETEMKKKSAFKNRLEGNSKEYLELYNSAQKWWPDIANPKHKLGQSSQNGNFIAQHESSRFANSDRFSTWDSKPSKYILNTLTVKKENIDTIANSTDLTKIAANSAETSTNRTDNLNKSDASTNSSNYEQPQILPLFSFLKSNRPSKTVIFCQEKLNRSSSNMLFEESTSTSPCSKESYPEVQFKTRPVESGKVSLETLINLIEEHPNGVKLSKLTKEFFERFNENLSAKKLTAILGLPSNIKNFNVAFNSYAPKIFHISDPLNSDPLICVRREENPKHALATIHETTGSEKHEEKKLAEKILNIEKPVKKALKQTLENSDSTDESEFDACLYSSFDEEFDELNSLSSSQSSSLSINLSRKLAELGFKETEC